MQVVAEVKVGKSRCSRYSQTLLNILSLVIALVAAGKLCTPSPLAVNLIRLWSQPAVVDVVVVTDRTLCQSPNFLVFSYKFKGMTMGCVCQESIVHSGYCLFKEIEQGCTETTPIYPSELSNYNSSYYFCARVAEMRNCSTCPSGFCSVVEGDPCPVVDLQLGVFPPAADYTAVGHVDVVGKILFISRSTANRNPLIAITTIKGSAVCLDPQVENLDGFTNQIYSEITLIQDNCTEGTDSRFTLLSQLPDYIMYASNNLSLVSEGNYFNTFSKSLPLVNSSDVTYALQLGQQDCKFVGTVVLLIVGCSIVFVVQQLLLHKYNSTKQGFTPRLTTTLLMVAYLVYMVMAAYSYSKLFDYLILKGHVNMMDDQSHLQMQQLQKNVEQCAKMLLGLASISTLASVTQLVLLIIECRHLCRRPLLLDTLSQKK